MHSKSGHVYLHLSGNNHTWGIYDEEKGRWTGVVGRVCFESRARKIYLLQIIQIERDEADIAVPTFMCTYARSAIAICSHGTDYQPLHWLTRYPLQLSPTWNLIQLLPPQIWLLVLISIIMILISFFIFVKTYHKLHFKTEEKEILLVPFRLTTSIKFSMIF